jgi:hypothetical protein
MSPQSIIPPNLRDVSGLETPADQRGPCGFARLLTITLACTALGALSAGRVAASPGKEVCDIRSVELVWMDCHATGLLVSGACAPVDANTSDFFGAPRSGYFYFACAQDGCRSAAERIAQPVEALPEKCWDFYLATFHPQAAPLPSPEPVIDYPIDWVGCERIKSYAASASAVSTAALDYRQVPEACDGDHDAGSAADGDAGIVQDSGTAPDAAAPLTAAGTSAGTSGVFAAGSHSAPGGPSSASPAAGTSGHAVADAGSPSVAHAPLSGDGGCSLARRTRSGWGDPCYSIAAACCWLGLRRRTRRRRSRSRGSTSVKREPRATCLTL